MSDLEATLVLPKTSELLAIRITEDNLKELAKRFNHTLFTRTGGKTAIFWCGIYAYPGETIVFSEAGGVIGIYDDEDIEKLFKLTGGRRTLRRQWPTEDLIIINDGEDKGRGIRIEPGTIALRDNEGEYYTREYGWLLRSIDKINDWAPIDPIQVAS